MKRDPFIIHTLDDQEVLLEEKCEKCNGAGIIHPTEEQWEKIKGRFSKQRSEIFLSCNCCDGSGLVVSSEGEALLKFLKLYTKTEDIFEAAAGSSIHNVVKELIEQYKKSETNIIGIFNGIELIVTEHENPRSLYWQYMYKTELLREVRF